MKYEYTHFIPENVSPKGATRIVVKDGDGKEVCSIPSSRFGGLTPPTGEPLYSFGLVSDCHTANWTTNWNGGQKLKNALAYFQRAGCKFVIGCGDFTQAGFYYDGANDYNEGQMLNYQSILEEYDIPVYEIFGNHENYYASIIQDIVRAKELTGIPHTAYTLSSSSDSDIVKGTTVRPNRRVPVRDDVRDDLFILVGQSAGGYPMSTSATDGDYEWLEDILKKNTDRRCFIFIHSFIDDNWGDKTTEQRDVERPAEDDDGFILNDSGNPCGARGNAIFGTWEDTTSTGVPTGTRATLVSFLDMLRQYPNAVIFHGHSHMEFESQEFDKCANYTDKNGFKSVHVPSLGSPRYLKNTDGDWNVYAPDGYTQPRSQCYRVDVYEDCIVLNGLSFLGATSSLVPLGTYKIEV